MADALRKRLAPAERKDACDAPGRVAFDIIKHLLNGRLARRGVAKTVDFIEQHEQAIRAVGDRLDLVELALRERLIRVEHPQKRVGVAKRATRRFVMRLIKRVKSRRIPKLD